MFCSNCGSEIADGANFCIKCGQKIGSSFGKSNSLKDRFSSASGMFSDMAKSAGQAINNATDGKISGFPFSSQTKENALINNVSNVNPNALYSYVVRANVFDKGTLSVFSDRIVFSSSKNGDTSILFSDIELVDVQKSGILAQTLTLTLTNGGKKLIYQATTNGDVFSEAAAYIQNFLPKAYSEDDNSFSFRGKIANYYTDILVYKDCLKYQIENDTPTEVKYSDVVDVSASHNKITISRAYSPDICIDVSDKQITDIAAEKIRGLLGFFEIHESQEKELFSYRVKTSNKDLGYLAIYDDALYLATSGGVTRIPYSKFKNMELAPDNRSISLVYKKGEYVDEVYYSSRNVDMRSGATFIADKIQEFLEIDDTTDEDMEDELEVIDKEFGMSDKFCVNESHDSFFIKYLSNKKSDVYQLNDIISCDIDEILVEDNAYKNSLNGAYFAGKSGAVLAATMSGNAGDVKKIICRIMVQPKGQDLEVLEFELLSPLFGGVSKTSSKYSTAKAETMKLEVYLKPYIEGTHAPLPQQNQSQNQQQSEQQQSPVPQVQSPQIDVTDELRKYKALMDDGILSEDEFIQKKKQLLGI